MTIPKPVVLCILDGWGLRVESSGNAVALAETPAFDELMMVCPNATLVTHGNDVGLPKGQMGNSEVGHTNIGAGRVVAMDLGQIDLAIEDRSFFQNPALMAFIDDLKTSGGTAHLMGLVSPGGVHSHQDHMVAAARALHDAGLAVTVHVITDGRDVAPSSAAAQVAQFLADLPEGVTVGSVTGRYFAMDRDNRWERVSRAYDAAVKGMGETAGSALDAIASAYARGETDEFIQPTAIDGYTGMHDGDGLFFLNFRADRAREILRAIGEPGFAEFDAGLRPKLAARLGMVDYSTRHNEYMTTCFPKQEIVNTLGEWVAKKGLRQFRLAETEKYPHVTFFLNGGKEEPEAGEQRYMAPSPKVATYDLQPEMSAPEVGRELVRAIHEKYDLIVVNFANPDMVGHTGDLDAAIAAVEAVDEQVLEAMIALKEEGGAMIVCADHGNCEMMVDPETGGPHTAHTTNPVPVALFNGPEGAGIRSGRLADLAPSLLDLMGIAPPAEMTGESLIVR
ncbi:2,3-bisphosphoglycerate-independent phosphoglycerate mutase [Maritimibacter sp. DP1N21-5]|uniref:2,3-bisphosphoglycerate-independent phosphoglycerate mutase n=1 Tax=Maritimibacter sp. DP1N21-5 TaxID=2836867 RepID=UPI001C4757AD|nr:2,3-bisphosphoglycerate-independent phosphoglycerate mutase [Maritimibacter sp. DP1N21-5]MBV7408268.1 2,3-bisphosphoglycerate-independent phosphoglycerate mutase [Maritimibacter sp. DP1N21-5]